MNIDLSVVSVGLRGRWRSAIEGPRRVGVIRPEMYKHSKIYETSRFFQIRIYGLPSR